MNDFHWLYVSQILGNGRCDNNDKGKDSDKEGNQWYLRFQSLKFIIKLQIVLNMLFQYWVQPTGSIGMQLECTQYICKNETLI